MFSQPQPRECEEPQGPQAKRPLPELYQVVIECEHEAQQRDLYEQLRTLGFKVRLLIL